MTFSNWVTKWIYQLAHVGWGGFLVMLLARHMPVYEAAPAVVAFAAGKEFIFDKLTETKALQGSDTQDFEFWVLGVILGTLGVIL